MIGGKSEICHWIWGVVKMSIWAVGIRFELLFGQIHSKDMKQLLPYRMGMFQQPRAESLSRSSCLALLYFSFYVAENLLGKKRRNFLILTHLTFNVRIFLPCYLDWDAFPWRCLVLMKWNSSADEFPNTSRQKGPHSMGNCTRAEAVV